MTSSDDDEADVYRRKQGAGFYDKETTSTILKVLVVYLNRFTRTLPSFTGQIVLLFCVLPVSFSVAIFLVTAIFNFGIAFIAQTISTVILLLILIPTVAVCVVSAIATAYILQFSRNFYLRISNSYYSSDSNSPPNFHRTISPPPEYHPKMEIEEKLKTC